MISQQASPKETMAARTHRTRNGPDIVIIPTTPDNADIDTCTLFGGLLDAKRPPAIISELSWDFAFRNEVRLDPVSRQKTEVTNGLSTVAANGRDRQQSVEPKHSNDDHSPVFTGSVVRDNAALVE